jgi:hypothetical protein
MDDLLRAIDVFLGLDSPPWEPDKYALAKRLPQKKKKK